MTYEEAESIVNEYRHMIGSPFDKSIITDFMIVPNDWNKIFKITHMIRSKRDFSKLYHGVTDYDIIVLLNYESPYHGSQHLRLDDFLKSLKDQ